MNHELFQPILVQKLGSLFSGSIALLETVELQRITPVASLAPELCPAADRAAAQALVRQQIRETKKEILYRTSPVLRQVEAVVLADHEAMAQEAAARIGQHRAEIGRVLLHGRSITEITGISGDGADVHNHGRLTLTVETPQGKFLYKPHSCEADRALFSLVERYFSDILRVPQSLDCGDYGFCEFIENRPAATRAGAEEYYRNFGGVTALLHALGAAERRDADNAHAPA